MQQIKFRTFEEAKGLSLPKTSRENIEKAEHAVDFVLRGNASRLLKLKVIFEATDLIISEVAPFSVCGKGCNHCCHIDVGVTEIEAKYIEKNTGKTVRIGRQKSSGYGELRTPCTFLSPEGDCSIYSYRPFACRSYLAFDSPVYCADISVEHVTYDPRCHPILKDFGRLLIELNNAGGYKDIRDFFPLAG